MTLLWLPHIPLTINPCVTVTFAGHRGGIRTRQGMAPSTAHGKGALSRFVFFSLPSGEDEHGGMALERTCQNLGSFNPQIYPVVFDARKRGLWNPGQPRELILAQLLELPDDTYGIAHGDIDGFPGLAVILHVKFSCNRVG